MDFLNIVNKGKEERDKCGEVGRKWVNSDEIGMNSIEMGTRFIKNINTTFEKWKPREKYTLEVV